MPSFVLLNQNTTLAPNKGLEPTTLGLRKPEEACRILGEKYGEVADECGDAYLAYGSALLDLSRMESGVLGNALKGIDSESEEESAASNDKVEDPEKVSEKEKEEIGDKVIDAMLETDEEQKARAEKEKGDEKKDGTTEEKKDEKKTEGDKENKEEENKEKQDTDKKEDEKTEDTDKKEEKKDEGLKYEHFEQHKLISEELELEPEEYIPTSCDKTCDQSHTVEIEDLGPDLEEDIEFQNSYIENDKPNLGKSDQPTSSEVDDGSWILKLIDLSGLEKWSDEDKNAAIEMIKRNANVFSKDDMDMGRTNLVKHHIELTDPIPFKESYRRIPPQMYDEVKAHIQEMLDLGAIRHSNSPWASAIVLVRKKDGRLRFCIDLRKLNNRTVKDAYSLPRIETLLDTFLGSTIFTTLDLKAGYWQVEMAEESKAFTAFTCGPLGFYECETMPFGATNAPATFQRLMHNCLGDLNMTWCVVYLDDIIVFSDNPKDHIVRLEAVFQKLASAGLKLKPSKCFFFKEEIDYLGHLVSGKGVATSPKKIEAVTKWPVPQTVYDVRSFLGFVGYYRRFIRDFSKISKPIREVIIGLENQSKRVAKKTLINWSEAAQSAFEVLKELCVNAPILAFPDYKLPFILHTDSSTEGLGAVLYQKQDGKLRVIAYASRSVTKTESNYPTHKLEFLALKWAICEKFHEYLYGSTPFEVYTDNNPLTYVLTTAKLDACGQRWVAKLANYNFTIQYRSGQSNVEADALSRISWPKVLDG